MKPQNIDLILLVDASESMKPCFAQLREHLNDLLFPLQQANFKVRFGLLAYAAGRNGSEPIYDHTFIGGSGPEMIQKLYGQSPQAADFFTSDSTGVTKRLAVLQAQGNEDTLLALDIAADFPFGPVESTRRVVAVFTDETIEAGISGEEPLAKMAELIQKLTTRRIQLFVSAPHSPALEELGSVDRAEIETVDGGDGLKSVDFKKLLAQMGKSISVSSLQMGSEPLWKKAIYGQDRWTSTRFAGAQDKTAIFRSGEIGGILVKCNKLGVLLDVSPSMTSFLPQLRHEISLHFSDAKYREAGSCSLAIESQGIYENSLYQLKELIEREECDGIYWFSDFQDFREPAAVSQLRNSLVYFKTKLYIRSIEQHPKDLIEITDETGGGYKNGPPSSLSH